MSQKDDSEDDIWEYKPLEKKKKRTESAIVTKRCTVRKKSKRDPSFPLKSPDKKVKKTAERGECSSVVNGHGASETDNKPSKSSTTTDTEPTDDAAAEGPTSGDFCPMCQMPFSILVVQTQRWHVAECLDTPRDTCKECPDGLQCFSTIPNHYKKFNHSFLAHSRANGDTVLLSLSQQAETSGNTSCPPGLINNEVDDPFLESSQDSAVSLSAVSNHSVSPQSSLTGTPPSKLTNGLLLLRSPGPEDFKKKKGWSSATKSRKSLSSSQESRTELSSTPVKAEKERQVSPKSEPFPDIDDAISYSPLSEFPAETEVNSSECRKALFNNDAFENDDEKSMVLFSDGFSSEDELLSEFIDNLETNNVQAKEPASLNTQLESVTSPTPTNQLAASAGAHFTGEKKAHGQSTSAISSCKSSIQSPQSIVLERLKETLLSSDLKSLNDSSIPVPSQTSIVQRSQTMPPQKGQSKAGQASCLKQTDIGVFFGLKPLKEKVKVAESGPNELNTTSLGENSGRRRQRMDRQRKSKADTTADTAQGSVAVGNVVDAQGEAGKGKARGWRGRRWNRGNADGEVEPRRCPFYKKIPGTKFVIDAFQYGEIEGITAYFLTHFHSDHYGGLTKKFTFPIYCNKITGNLVKSKLKVAEQHVNILPMNTQVTVEGVEVILLEANHCPGAAMLLFFLPDGQTVLHTGDFRADPSMETYPELLSCRVQTLYLDTTYCSPEYTFPRQQEVINFAASTAFELVTLNPRTLVVCGSYSVGKEKVFLALAEVLGSKVCLSRDKYNTMCCLESEQVRQRITTDWKAAQVHVLPMMQLSFKKLQDHLARFSDRYDQLVAFKPTGWTFSQQMDSVADIQPQTSGNISIYGIPYSEHSSFLELKRFVQWLQPLKIIPTVNVGNWASRKAMEKCFSEWLMETRAKL
ncbi:DNA cross-link repair 1A protein [Centropristis striata]|uniref:DNA cross-link repair 1A protein n=1 Tax=Centropristis striata TaxID=184440 RepID=UPI0027DF6184|nr:DNA cross-link repair 1A protein [Centropristis striata]XP_059181169.1 DNA cross-link repair 1A protein [Centropristis striata]XP_059181171.1 DNA cross-link repair 1A protein [Centropristis striata]